MFHRAVRWALGVMRALLRALLPSLLPAMAQDDPSFDRISELYPLLGWSREGLGVADHSAAAALDRSPTVITSAAHSGQLCSVVYPLHPPVCSATKGKCTTEPSDVGSAYFVLTLRGGGDGLGEDAALAPERIVLNCSHSSTRTLKGFAPIVQVQSTAAAFQPAAQALTHRDDTDSCAPLGNVSGQRWVEYGNVCAGFYCNLGPPTTTKFCQRPDICSGCPNTPQCASNCSGDGQLSAASCDCAAAGKFCKLLRRGQTDTGARDICRRALPPSVGLGPLAAQLEFNQTLFAATEGMDSKKPLGVFLGLTIRRRASASVGLIAVAVELTGDGAEPLELATAEVGADTITVHAAVRVAGGTQAPFVNISAADFAGNLSAAEAYWKTKIEPAKGPTVPEPRVMTAWKAKRDVYQGEGGAPAAASLPVIPAIRCLNPANTCRFFCARSAAACSWLKLSRASASAASALAAALSIGGNHAVRCTHDHADRQARTHTQAQISQRPVASKRSSLRRMHIYGIARLSGSSSSACVCTSASSMPGFHSARCSRDVSRSM
eukprot:COSAG06_NODE_2325_length_7083_cov_2.294101_2_plen_550_part_00